MADELKNLINGERLQEYNEQIKKTYVKQEEGKGLSTNDLTNDLVKKINEAAAKNDFSGDYDDLENKPAIDGHELDASSTAAGLGLATNADLPTVATAEKAGLVIPDNVTIKADATGKITAQLTDYAKRAELPGNATDEEEGLVKGDGTTITIDDGVASVKDGVFTKPADLTDFVTQEDIDTSLEPYAKTATVNEQIEEVKAKVTAAVHVRGSIKFASLPAPSASVVGDLYDISDQFVTDTNFVNPNQDFAAGTNVICIENPTGTYKWDTYSGYIDMSAYPQRTEITIAPASFITGLFE